MKISHYYRFLRKFTVWNVQVFLGKNYLEEIWDAICTIFNIKWSVTGGSLNFWTQKSEKTCLVLH